MTPGKAVMAMVSLWIWSFGLSLLGKALAQEQEARCVFEGGCRLQKGQDHRAVQRTAVGKGEKLGGRYR